jgi:hypothetical protein
MASQSSQGGSLGQENREALTREVQSQNRINDENRAAELASQMPEGLPPGYANALENLSPQQFTGGQSGATNQAFSGEDLGASYGSPSNGAKQKGYRDPNIPTYDFNRAASGSKGGSI